MLELSFANQHAKLSDGLKDSAEVIMGANE